MPYLFKLTKRLAASWYAPVALLPIAACGTDMPTQLSTTSASFIGSTSSVSVYPASLSGTLSEPVQFTALVRDSRGQTITGRPVTWTSTDSTVVAIAQTGLATSRKAGTATITATSGTVSGTASATITPPAGPPSPAVPPWAAAEPVPASGTTLWRDTFDAPDAGIGSYAVMQADYLHADPLAGDGGTSGALRMDWPRSTTCSDEWTGLDRAIPGAPTELYIQFSVRYQPGFQFDWRNAGASPCDGNAKKLFLVWSGDNRSRFMYVSEDHELRAASDYENGLGTSRSQNTGPAMSLEQYADGKWHRVTFHIKQSSSITATDGFLYGWIDGVRRWSRPNWASGSVGGWVEFKMPSTFNQGSPANQSEWVDNLTIWRP